MVQILRITCTDIMDQLNERLKLGHIEILNITADNVVTYNVIRFTEKERSVVYKIKIIGYIEYSSDYTRTYNSIGSIWKDMIGAEFEARLVNPNAFEIIATGMCIPCKYCELIN